MSLAQSLQTTEQQALSTGVRNENTFSLTISGSASNGSFELSFLILPDIRDGFSSSKYSFLFRCKDDADGLQPPQFLAGTELLHGLSRSVQGLIGTEHLLVDGIPMSLEIFVEVALFLLLESFKQDLIDEFFLTLFLFLSP